MKVWIFSDLHLESSSDPLFSSLLSILNGVDAHDQVVLNGDIFDLLVGPSDYFKNRFTLLFETVHQLAAKGVKIHYIEGNHDFHVSRLFPKSVNFQDEFVNLEVDTSLGKKKIHIAHGDLIDREDHGYLRLRAIFRSSFIRHASQVVPGAFIGFIADQLGRSAHEKEKDLPHHWASSKLETLRKKFRGYAETKHRQGFDYIVLGHCHDLDEVTPFYFNMGYPPVHRQFLIFDSEARDQKELLKRRNFPGI